MEKSELNRLFYKLQEQLDKIDLPREDGQITPASCGEFMLMQETETELQFKHICTRNYVILRKPETINGDYKLVIPQTNMPFFRGFF